MEDGDEPGAQRYQFLSLRKIDGRLWQQWKVTHLLCEPSGLHSWRTSVFLDIQSQHGVWALIESLEIFSMIQKYMAFGIWINHIIWSISSLLGVWSLKAAGSHAVFDTLGADSLQRCDGWRTLIQPSVYVSNFLPKHEFCRVLCAC